MSNAPTDLPSIDPAALVEVTGGLTDDGKILEALKGIQDTINGLGKNNNNGFSFEQFLPFLLMAFGGGGGGGIGGPCPCGCGMRGGHCRRR